MTGPHYWTGRFAMAVAVAVRDPEPKLAQKDLKMHLDAFLKERPHGDELGDMLRKEMKR